MATITGVNIYIDGVKHNSTPQPLTQATYNISNVKAEGASFNVQFSYVYDDGSESGLTAVQSYSLAAAVTALQPLTFESATTLFDKNNYEVAKSSPVNQLWHPVIYYKNGKTLAGLKVSGSNRFNVLEYTPNGLRPPHRVFGSSGLENSHDHPVLHWEIDRLYIVQENAHNLNPPKLHKSKSNNDSLIFKSNLKDIGTEAHTYFNLTKNNGKLVSVGQFSDTEAGFIINSLGTIESSWSTNYKILNRQVGEAERYQMGVNNKSKSSDVFIISAGRNDLTATPTWFRFNVFKAKANASGYLDYYTVDNQLIAAPTTALGTTMSDSQVSQGEFYYTGSNTSQGYQPIPSLDELGNFYCVHGNGSGAYILSIWKTNSSNPVNQTLTFPDAPTLVINNPDQWGACAYLMPEKPSKIDLFFKVDNGIRKVIRHYRSVDEGVTLTFVQDVDFGFDVVSFGIASNYIDIGNNKNFIAIAGGDNATNENGIVDVGIKKAAFGTIQAELGNIYDSLTPISESVFNAASILNYSIESGKINNTGTTLDSLIDQSANAVTEVAFGSPVLDNEATPSFVTFDGLNDYVSLNPALLVADNAYLILEVVDTNGVDVTPLTISNNSNSNNFILPDIQGGANSRMANRARQNTTVMEEVRGDSATSVGFQVYAWLYRGYSNDVNMWYNGKMQLRNVITKPSVREGSYELALGNTHLEIGRLVRNTTSYLPFKMKHISVHSVTSEQDVLDKIKFLGNKYGITLLNNYR